MRSLGKFIFCCAALLAGEMIGQTPAARAQGGVPLWTNRYHGPAYGRDQANAIAADSSGNVFVTGTSIATNTFFNDDYDYATVAYSTTGMALWTNRFNLRPGAFRSSGIAVLAAGRNVFVTGTSGGFATIGYSITGVSVWTNLFDDGSADCAVAMAVDSQGNVFVAGNVEANSFNQEAYATVGYSRAGIPLWTNFYHWPPDSTSVASAITVDAEGNVFVTGTSIGDSYENYATVAYSSAGAPLWTNWYSGEATAIAMDKASGKLLVTGYSGLGTSNGPNFATVSYSTTGVPLWTNLLKGIATAATFDQTSGNALVAGHSWSGSISEYVTVAYSRLGAPLWTNRYHGPAAGESDVPSAVTVDISGNVFVTGSATISTNFAFDFATLAYSPCGVPLWTNRYQSGCVSGCNQRTAIAVDGRGNVFVTGTTTSEHFWDYVTIKYSTSIMPYLSAQRFLNQLVLSWTNSGFALQSSPAMPGVFTNIPGTTSPYTNSTPGSQQFFRLTAP